MKRSHRYAGCLAMLGVVVAAPALAGPNGGSGTGTGGGTGGGSGGTIVLNTFNKVLPQMIGDALGPMKSDGTPKVGRCTGVGYMDPQLKMDDSPTAVANYAKEVSLLITATRSDSQDANPGGNSSYMQGAFSVVKVTPAGPQTDAMKLVNLPNLEGERNWQKPNIIATDKNYLLVAASEDNGQNNNPQVVAFVYDKTTLQPVPVLNSNRQDSTTKPTNLIELSGKNDDQQYGPHSIMRIPGTPNSFVMGVQRNNQNAYVLGVTVDETPGTGVNLKVDYLTRVINNAQHCRPDVITNAADPGVGFLTSVEANDQPADIGVQALKFDLTTGKVITRSYVAKSDPQNNKYAVQPNIADLGSSIAVSYQLSEKTRRGGNNQGHTGGSNLNMIQILDKATLTPTGAPIMAVSAYARHAGAIGGMWGEDGSAMPALISISGSSLGTGKGFAQIVPFDVTTNQLGTKDPGKLYEISQYSDIAGTVVRGKRNPNDQARGFIYAQTNVPNPGYMGGNTAFMPEVKYFTASATQGYTDSSKIAIAARESVWLSLVPSVWVAGQPTTPGGVTATPGTNADGTGPLPRTNVPGTNTNPNTPPPQDVIPGGTSPQPGGGTPGSPGAYGPGGINDSAGGCAVSTTGSTAGGAFGFFVVGLGALFGLRRNRKGGK